jgi:hypothetical protein
MAGSHDMSRLHFFLVLFKNFAGPGRKVEIDELQAFGLSTC